MFDCPQTQNLKTKLKYTNWDQVWNDKTGKSQKLLVAFILSSWSEEEGSYLKFFRNTYTSNYQPPQET